MIIHFPMQIHVENRVARGEHCILVSHAFIPRFTCFVLIIQLISIISIAK